MKTWLVRLLRPLPIVGRWALAGLVVSVWQGYAAWQKATFETPSGEYLGAVMTIYLMMGIAALGAAILTNFGREAKYVCLDERKPYGGGYIEIIHYPRMGGFSTGYALPWVATLIIERFL